MGAGVRGRFDERQVVYPDAPLFSVGGHRFLVDLTAATVRRLKYSLRDETDMADRLRWELLRLRGPDAGRIMWAMGKLKWQSHEVHCHLTDCLPADIKIKRIQHLDVMLCPLYTCCIW
jgi:hypothetical protein